jgi:hypothetical protein
MVAAARHTSAIPRGWVVLSPQGDENTTHLNSHEGCVILSPPLVALGAAPSQMSF